MKRKTFPWQAKSSYKYPGMFIEKSEPPEAPVRRKELFTTAKRIVR